MDSQATLAQGKIDKIEIIRNNQVFELPEYRNTPNQLRYTAWQAIDYFTFSNSSNATVGHAGIVELSATLPAFRELSGTWGFTRSTNTFARASGTSTIQQTGVTTIILPNGLFGTANNSGSVGATTTSSASFYSLSNGLSAPPIPHYADFTGISAKMTQFPSICVATGSSGTSSHTLTAVAATGVMTRTIVSTTAAVVNGAKSIKGIVLGGSSGGVNMPSPWTYIILSTPFDVEAGDQVTITYTLSAQARNQFYNVNKTISEYIQGWPFRYNITSLSGNGSVVTASVAATPKMHFLSGDKITIEAVPLRKAITSINSNGAVWTVTSTSHNLTVSDTIVHENITNATYNGTYVVASTPDLNTYTITNAVNPGASSGGTVRLNTPGTYFSGEYNVISATATTVSINNTATGPLPDIATSILTSPDRCKLYSFNMSEWVQNSSGYRTYSSIHIPQAISAFPLPANFTNSPYTFANSSYITRTNQYNNDTGNISLGINDTPANGVTTVDGFARIKRVAVHRTSSSGSATYDTKGSATIMDFETPQPKHQGYTLLINPIPIPNNVFIELPAYNDA